VKEAPRWGDAKRRFAMVIRRFALDGFDFIYDASRKGAKFSFDGAHWMNAGEFMECAIKWAFGYAAHKDANARFDVASDIPEMNASVKSSKASLTNMALAPTFEESVNVYFANVHSTCFIYGVIIDGQLTVYEMDAATFRSFIYHWASLNERGVIRFKATSGKMIQWLENQA
jgi:hypothetical protein